MKKLAVLISLLAFTCTAVQAQEGKKVYLPEKPNQNIFSLIKIDLSVFSPKLSVSDSPVDLVVSNNQITSTEDANNKEKFKPVANQTLTKETTTKAETTTCIKKDTTKNNDNISLFRLDVLKLFKISLF